VFLEFRVARANIMAVSSNSPANNAMDGGLLRQTAVVAGSAALAQGITFLAAPVLTRIYSPADFGLFGTYAAIVALGAVASGLRYDLAIALPRREAGAANVAALAALAAIVLPAIMLAVLALLPLVCDCGLSGSALAPYLWVLPLGIAAAGLYQVAAYWALRQHAFRGIATSRICQSSSAAGLQLLLGWTGWGAAGLMAGTVLSHLVGMATLTATLRGGFRRNRPRIRPRRMRMVARRYERFPKFLVLEGLAMVAGMQLPILLFAANFTATTVGQFVLAVQVAQAPLRLLGSAVGQVFIARAAPSQRSGQLDQLASDTLRVLARLGIAPLALFAIVATDAFSLVFGEQWGPAGTLAGWLTPVLIAEFLFLPLSVIVAMGNHQRAALTMRVLLVGLPAMTIPMVASSSGNPVAAVQAFSAAGLAAYLAYGAWLMRLAGVNAARWLSMLAREMARTAPPVAILVGAKLWLAPKVPAPTFVALGVALVAMWLYPVVRRIA
jgi:O-antigen/teichoic acid export membrane protein